MRPAWRTTWLLVLGALLWSCASTEKPKKEPPGWLPDEAGEIDLRYYREEDLNRLFIELNSLTASWQEAALKHDEVVKEGIADQLRKYVTANYDMIRRSIGSENRRYRIVAAATIGFADRPDAAELLYALLGDEDELVVSNALLSLGQLSPLRRRLDPVVELLDQESESVRSNALRVLARNLEPDDRQEYLPVIREHLDASDGVVRLQATAALAELGPDAEVVTLLAKRLEDPFKRIRIRAALALGELGQPAAVPALIDLLEHEGADERSAAAEALREITGEDHGSDAAAWRRAFESESFPSGS